MKKLKEERLIILIAQVRRKHKMDLKRVMITTDIKMNGLRKMKMMLKIGSLSNKTKLNKMRKLGNKKKEEQKVISIKDKKKNSKDREVVTLRIIALMKRRMKKKRRRKKLKEMKNKELKEDSLMIQDNKLNSIKIDKLLILKKNLKIIREKKEHKLIEIKELSYWKKQGNKVRINIFKIIKMTMKILMTMIKNMDKRGNTLIDHQVEITTDKRKENVEMLL